MEQILQAYGLPKETVAAKIVLCKNMKAVVYSTEGDKYSCVILTFILQWNA